MSTTDTVAMRPLAGAAATRCCPAGRCAPGLLARGGYPVPARLASGPANQAIGIVAAVGSLAARCPAGASVVPAADPGTVLMPAGHLVAG